MDAAGKKKEAAEKNSSKNRLSIGSLFFFIYYLSCFCCICKIENTASILLYKSLVL
jgi:hypothetical protein